MLVIKGPNPPLRVAYPPSCGVFVPFPALLQAGVLDDTAQAGMRYSRVGSHCPTHLTASFHGYGGAASLFASLFCNSGNFELPRAAVLIVRGIGRSFQIGGSGTDELVARCVMRYDLSHLMSLLALVGRKLRRARALPFIQRTAGCAMIALHWDRKRIE